MADPKHLKILQKGVLEWNRWRDLNPQIIPNLSEEMIVERNLGQVNFSHASLSQTNFSHSDLSEANFFGANISMGHFIHANLREARLDEATAVGADLHGANLEKSFLTGTVFIGAKLVRAKLNGAKLFAVAFNRTHVVSADFSNAVMSHVSMADTDLSEVIGLDSVRHEGPSTIGLDTLLASKGKIPEAFLRGVGLPDIFIEYASSLAGKPIEFYSAFISYSSNDDDFAKQLYAHLQAKGVRCWFAPEDLKIGDRFRFKIDEAIRVHDKLLLILSENSVESNWVEKEVESAFEREQREKKIILFPIRLDDAVMEIQDGWPADIRRTRHIGDFREWKNHDSYQNAFERLLRDLKSENLQSNSSGEII